MSHTAYCLYLMRRALARPASELPASRRPAYEAHRALLAQQLISAGC